MTTPVARPGGSLEQRRVPFNERVEIKFKLFQEFVSELSDNLSMGGMFLKTRLSRDPGSQFEFRIRLSDDYALIEGTGEVAWRRAEDEAPERPAGMGVRFVSLTAESHKLIRRIVEEHTKSGGKPFDLAQEAPRERVTAEDEPSATAEPPPVSLQPPTEVGPAPESEAPLSAAPSTSPSAVPTPAPAAAAAPPVLEPSRPPAASAAKGASASSPWQAGWPGTALRLGALVLMSAVVGGSAVWLGHRILIQPQLDALARQVDELSYEAGARLEAARPPRSGGLETEVEPVPAGSVAAPRRLPEAVRLSSSLPPGDEVERDAAIEAVRAWARAWSEKRFDDYLGSYSRKFQPPNGLSRAAWEVQRRSRIERPGPISVTVAAMEAQDLPGDQKLVRCTQAYRSARYSDIVRKAILLTWEDDAWRIVEERVER